jgi:hypothetical protein
LSHEPITDEHVAAAIRATLDLFLEDAPEIHGREPFVDPAPAEGDGIALRIDEAEFLISVQRLPS